MDHPEFGKVVLLFGGKGTALDRECSLVSGGSVLQELIQLGVDAEGFDPVTRPLSDLMTLKPDRIFNCLFSRDGEDGRLQGWLEQLGVPYTGSGVLASALTFDKIKCKKILQGSGVPTSPFVALYASTWKKLSLKDILSKLGGDVFVKPAREASTMGAPRACDVIELTAAIEKALERDDQVIVEKFLPGKEFTVPVIGGEVLPPCELMYPGDNCFYSAEIKYELPPDKKNMCPSSLSKQKEEELKRIVLDGYEALGMSEYCRADCRQDEKGDFYILEYNSGAMLNKCSTFAASARVVDISYSDLILKLLSNASTNKY